MFGSDVLEIALGLVFVYLLMSLLCSVINEQVIARFFALRSKTLEEGIKTMLNDPRQTTDLAEQFYNHPLIQGLAKQGDFDSMRRRISKPSYISPEIFAMVIKDLVDLSTTDSNVLPSGLKTVMGRAEGNAQQQVVHLERWFDDTMQRVSGWYKRKVQLIILALAFIITIYLNVDTIALISNLSNSAILRSSIVSAAQGTDKNVLDPNTNLKLLQTEFQQIQPQVGWTTFPGTFSDWMLKIVGLLATTFAVSLGAPFWFDTLNKFMQFRAVGNPPPPSVAPLKVSASSQQNGNSSIAVSASSQQANGATPPEQTQHV